MVALRVEEKRVDVLSGLTKYLTVALGVLVGLVILVNNQNPGITGFSVFSKIYGGSSQFLIVSLLLVIIFLYVRIRRE